MAQILDFSNRVAETFHPEKIILFGSYAYGQPDISSDVDLLVIMPVDGDPVDLSVAMRMKFRPSFPLDLLVKTPSKIRERIAMGDDFIRDVIDRGRVLYEAAHA